MRALIRHWQLASLLMIAWVCMACNPMALPYFLMVGSDPKYDPDFTLVPDEKGEPLKIVVLTASPLAEIRPELMGADRELAGLFAQELQKACTENKEKVVLASTSKVQKYKDQHPNWQSLSLEEIGKQLDTHYVIDMEINRLTLYESGSQNTFFHGNAAISVTLADMRRPGENPVFRKEFVTEYPHSRGPLLATDTNPQKFRRDFLARVATELTWFFTAHPTSDHYNCE